MDFDVVDLDPSQRKRFLAYLAEQIDELREANDNPALDDLGTAVLRGKLMLAKELYRAADLEGKINRTKAPLPARDKGAGY